MEIKTIVKFDLSPIGVIITQNPEIIDAGDYAEQKAESTVCEKVDMWKHHGRQHRDFSEI